jgi:hypothetical protein
LQLDEAVRSMLVCCEILGEWHLPRKGAVGGSDVSCHLKNVLAHVWAKLTGGRMKEAEGREMSYA